MKFAFVSSMASVPWGGSEILWHSACNHLARQGHQVAVAYPKWPVLPKPVELLRELGVTVYEHGTPLTARERLSIKIRQKAGLATSMERERKWLRKIKPDILCISSGNAIEGAPWMRLAADENVPYVTIAQAHAEFLWPDDDAIDSLIKLFNTAKRCYFVSKGNLNLLETQLGIFIENAEVVSNHSTVWWNSNPEWTEPVDGIFKLACVGRLHPSSKGQDILFNVLKQPKWVNRPLLISLYGEGPQERSLRRLVEQYRLHDKTKFCGHVGDISNIWKENHALVLPSRYEGLPLALVEAMMCGRTAIVTNVAGNAEVIEHRVTGFLAEAATVSSLDRAMEEAWEERNKWYEMGKKAQSNIYKKLPEDPGLILAKKIKELCKTNK